MSGYLHHRYAQSLSEFGSPVELTESQGWILKRKVSGYEDYDATGCYPLFSCRDWSSLKKDFKEISSEIICLALVTDPFGDYDEKLLYQCFKDVMFPFKEHHIIDLRRPKETFICSHHQRYAKKAIKNIKVERCEKPTEQIEDWLGLYGKLINKHKIKGVAKFSKNSFEQQLSVPGIVVFRATLNGLTVGMLLWYVQNNVAYYHLGASSEKGYNMQASFALFWFAIDHFANYGLKWINLGAGAGVKGNSDDGLTQFKRGWASGTRTAYFCGHVFNQYAYSEIVKAKKIQTTNYFPSYRKNEF